jgi:hypothetical protein
VQAGDTADVRLDLGQLLSAQTAQPRHTIRRATALELVQPSQLLVRRGHDQLAAARRRDAALLTVRVQLAGAGHAQLRLQRARGVVDALVDDARVVAGLVSGDAPLPLQHLHTQARMPRQQLAGRRQPQDAGPNDDEITLTAGTAHPGLSDQS